MSTSDQQGDQPLTRKQLREIRLTGATPVIGEEEAAAAKNARPAPAVPVPKPAAPVEIPAPVDEAELDTKSAPLTRRQARAHERIRTASVPVIVPEQPTADANADDEPAAEADASEELEDADEPISAVPVFAPVSAQRSAASDDVDASEEIDDSDDVDDSEESEEPETAFESDVDAESDEFSTVFGVSEKQAEAEDAQQDAAGEGDELPVADAVITGERPVVGAAFGKQVFTDKPDKSDVPAFAPSFDELITSDSGGSNRAANALIFTHPGEGSLSGPVASTGELLVTGSYELPRGIGSQGHAHGAADSKETDAVLIDGELAPASSPTPIAASSAVSTIKPAGEVIRPPAPEKGNKLMLTLAITAGGLALALAVALVVAFTTNVFG